MLVRIIGCALLAGVVAGGLSAVLQQALVIPVLLEAETYESGEVVHFGGAAAAPAAEHSHASDAGHSDSAEAAHDHGEGGEGLQRHVVTGVMTVAINVGFAMLLVAAFYARDAQPDWRRGMIWGLCGFVAFMAAPSAGLAPELPGTAAADLESRQVWWVLTAVLAIAGLWLIAFVRTPWALPAAVAAFAIPHVVGAPHPEGWVGSAPPELAAEFAARVLAVGLVSWAVLGAVAAWAWGRQPLEGA
jgi:cobalt transporter subunit CbtA